MQKKQLFALILLVCLVASSFLLLPTVKANETLNLSVSGTGPGYWGSLQDTYATFSATFVLSSATLNGQNIIELRDADGNYGWGVSLEAAYNQIAIFDSYSHYTLVVFDLTTQSSFTLTCNGTTVRLSGVASNNIITGFSTSTDSSDMPSINMINSENPLAQYYVNPSGNGGTASSGAVGVSIETYSPSPTPTPTPTATPTPTPTATPTTSPTLTPTPAPTPTPNPTQIPSSTYLQQTGQLILPDGEYLSDGIMASSAGYIYLYCTTTGGVPTIYKVDESTMSIVGSCTTEGGYFNNPMFIIGNYLYFAETFYNSTTFGIQDYITKVDTSDMTAVANYTDPNGDNALYYFSSDGTYLYVSMYLQPSDVGEIYKIDPSTMTLVATSVDFDYNFVSLYPYDGMLIAEGFTGYETNIADGSLYEINTSNLAVVNSYIHGENLSANFWGSMAFGASDIFSGAEQHIYEFSSGISQIGEWNDPSDDYVSCVLCGNYLIAALMSVDSPSETYDAIAVISSSSMTTLSTFYTLSINGEVKNVMASSNFVYAEVATDTEDIIAQFSLITPTPPSSGGGGGLATPTPTSSASPSGSGLPVSVSPAPAKLSAIEIFSIAVLSVLAGLALLAVMLHKGKRRRR